MNTIAKLKLNEVLTDFNIDDDDDPEYNDDDDPEYLAYEKQIIESRKGAEQMNYEDFKKEHGL